MRQRPDPRVLFGVLLSVLLACVASAGAQEPSPPPFTLGGYAEAFYQWNFNRPRNGITNFRGFDNRHDSFALSNVALDAQWDSANVVGRVTLQVGITPSTYYASEPRLDGSAGAAASSAELWKYVQQGYAGYRFMLPRPLLVTAGIFLAPIGPESMAVRDNWNWSRSNLFVGLPFYHTGARAEYQATDNLQVTLGVYNGWNSVIDNNRHKSLAGQLSYTLPGLLNVSVLYFGGVERSPGALEGAPFRHLFDSHATYHVTPWLSLMANANAGFERNRIGVSHWTAGALYARARLLPVLFVALRADVFREHVARSGAERAAPLFWPVASMQSSTATLEYRPAERLSFRLELRHDRAANAAFFGGRVARDSSDEFIANRRTQSTLTAGVTAWF